jgi:hypothetical protein
MSIRHSDVRQYALVGAQAQLDTLRAEVATLLSTFPELRGGRSAAADTSDRTASHANGTGRQRAGRRKMTAAQRKAVGERMAKYWARRRREKAGKGTKAAKSAKTSKTVTATA